MRRAPPRGARSQRDRRQGENPIGKTIRIDRPDGSSADELPGYPEVTVVGTVRDIVTGMLVMGTDAGHIDLPMTSSDPHATAILVRGRTERELHAEALQEISLVDAPRSAPGSRSCSRRRC